VISRAIFEAVTSSPFCIFDRRDRQGDIDEASVPALSNRLVVFDTLTTVDTFENDELFVMSIRWNENRYWLTHGLLRGITKKGAPRRGFQLMMTPLRSLERIASADDSIIAA
jgi:hypothetical protein